MTVTITDPQGARPRPASLRWSLISLAALVALGGLATVLVVIFEDKLLRHWAEGNLAAREILHTQGLDALKDPPEGQVAAPQVVQVTVVLFIVMALLFWVLGVFLRNGFEWARVTVTGCLLISIITGIAGIIVDPAALFVVLIAGCVAVCATVLGFLWQPETSRFIHHRD